MFSKLRVKQTLQLLLIGGLLGSLGDFSHLGTRTTAYPFHDGDVFIFGLMPWWVPILFAVSTCILGWGHLIADRVRQTYRRPTLKQCELGLALFVGEYVASGFIPATFGAGKDVILAAMALLGWWGLNRTRGGLLDAAITAVIGTCAETFIIRGQAFQYLPEHANFGVVPSWLPWLYFAASIGGGDLARSIYKPLLIRDNA